MDSPFRLLRPRGASGGELRRARSAVWLAGQPDGEADSFARSGLDLDRASVLLDDAVADRKAEAGPLADGLGGEERVEDPLADRRLDAAAGVGDLDPDSGRLGLGPVRIVTVPSGVAGVDGVHEQVDDDLVNASCRGSEPAAGARARETSRTPRLRA